MRGRSGDSAKHHVSNGLYLEPGMKASDLPYTVIECAGDLAEIGRAWEHAKITARPAGGGFTRDVLRGNR